MKSLISFLILLFLTDAAWSQEKIFVGRVDMVRDLASFETSPAVKGTLYLLTGSAASVEINRQSPYEAVVDFIEGVWISDSDLTAYHVRLHFDGKEWASVLLSKRPRDDGLGKIYPYRRFQVAALAIAANEFRVIAIPQFF